MTDIEEKALALVNEILEEWGKDVRYLALGRLGNSTSEALCRALEQHEAYKQEVSDAIVSEYLYAEYAPERMQAFIIPKPKADPLVEVMKDWFGMKT